MSYQSFATRYNPVPGIPNCHYDTQAKTHVWHLVDSKGQWTGPGIGYSKANCLAARDAYLRSKSGTRTKDPVPTKQLNPPNKPQTLLDYLNPFLLFANQQPSPAPLGGTGRGVVSGVPRSSTPGGGGIGDSGACKGCNPLDMGCAIGKQFCEFQAWIAKNVGGAALPAIAVTGVIVLLLAIKR